MCNDLKVIAHANHLVEACYDLDVNEIRLIILACTKYRFTFDSYESIEEIRISISEFIEMFELKKAKGTYTDLKKAVQAIMRKPISIFSEKTGKFEEYAWLVKNSYDKDESRNSFITMKFSPEIAPYLFELKKRFTAINFEYAAKLNTPFSFRLYQWLYREKELNKSKKGGTVEVVIQLEDIKKRACLNNSYCRWDNFKLYVIKPAVEKINAVTDISVSWKPIKTGKSVTAIQFNYILEKINSKKPIRPRLSKRPKVLKGSHAEGEWARTNYNLLSKYRTELKTYDKTLSLTLPDLRKMHEYASIIGYKEIADMLEKEIDARTPAPKPEKKFFDYDDPKEVEKLYQLVLEMLHNPIVAKMQFKLDVKGMSEKDLEEKAMKITSGMSDKIRKMFSEAD